MSETKDQQEFARADGRESEFRGEVSDSGPIASKFSAASSSSFTDGYVNFGNGETAAGLTPTTADLYHSSRYPSQPPVSKAVAGPFTARDLFVIGLSTAILLISFIPSTSTQGFRWFMMWSDVNWISGLVYVGGVVAVGALFIMRRVAPHLAWTRRTGSFSTDQLASVVAVYSALDWFAKLIVFSYLYISRFNMDESNLEIALLGFLAAMGYVLVTVCAPHIPRLRDDFDVRPEEVAHRVARAIIPAVQAPKPELFMTKVTPAENSNVTAEPYIRHDPEGRVVPEKSSGKEASYVGQQPQDGADGFGEKPFWFAVATETEVFDEQSQRVAFTLKTGVWYLALQDRGAEFLVTDRSSLDEEKNIVKRGILKNIEGVERA